MKRCWGALHGCKGVISGRASRSERERQAGEVALQGLQGRVLLAEDIQDLQHLFGGILRRAGVEVDFAEDGRSAVEKALESRREKKAYDLILMDIKMPGMDGYQATGRLRAEGWEGPIVALTAHAMTNHREKCLVAGCNDYGSKPISRDELIGTIAPYLLDRTRQQPGSPPSG